MPRTRLRLVLYTREGCGLCDEMLDDLAGRLSGQAVVDLELRDVDADDADRARYGLLVPVLVADGRPLCNGRLDPDVLDELLGE